MCNNIHYFYKLHLFILVNTFLREPFAPRLITQVIRHKWVSFAICPFLDDKSIRNLDMLLTITIGYIGIMSEKAEERQTVMELIQISKRIFNVPKFKFYAIADGFFAVFAGCKQGIADLLRKKPKDPQLTLFPAIGFLCP